MSKLVGNWLGKPFSVGVVDQLFQPASNQVETVEKHLAVIKSRSYRVSTENGKKSVLFLNCQPHQPKPVTLETVDPNRTQPYHPCEK